MTKDEALELLTTGSSAQRLRAARYLSTSTLTKGDQELIRFRADEETDSWVLQALESLLRPRTSIDESASEAIVDVRTLSEIQAQATEQVTRLVLHEIGPIVGALESWGKKEFDGFEGSRTWKSLQRLSQLLDTLSALNSASVAPTIGEFDLTTLVGDVSIEFLEQGARIAFGRSDPIVVSGDSSLIHLALQNCLKNAVEAVEATGESERSIVINWGDTDRDYWLAVLDEGIGLPDSADKILTSGVSTKDDKGTHFGIGLTIVQRAMHTLNGTVEPRRRDPRGSVVELRWPKR